MSAPDLSNQWPQFTGDETLPWTGFVKEHPDDRPDQDTGSLRGHMTIETPGHLQQIIARQRTFTSLK